MLAFIRLSHHQQHQLSGQQPTPYLSDPKVTFLPSYCLLLNLSVAPGQLTQCYPKMIERRPVSFYREKVRSK